MRALIKEAGEVRLVDVPAPEARRPGDVVVQVLVAGICRTDLQVAAGTVPSADPITLGHELAGCVAGTRDLVAADPRVDGGFLGVDRHGAFAELVVIPAANLHVLPPHIDPRAAAYVEPIAAALAAPDVVAAERFARLEVEPWRGVIGGDTRFSRLLADVFRIDGFDVELQPDASGLADAFDFAVETSGDAREIAALVHLVRPGGLFVLKSRKPGGIEMPVDTIVAKDLTIRARAYGAFERAVELVATGAIDLAPLFGETLPLARYREAFALAAAGEAHKIFLSCVA